MLREKDIQEVTEIAVLAAKVKRPENRGRVNGYLWAMIDFEEMGEQKAMKKSNEKEKGA